LGDSWSDYRNVGDQYICTDGPVFRYEQIQHFLEAF
jgi:NAD(P)H-flavin reductase